MPRSHHGSFALACRRDPVELAVCENIWRINYNEVRDTHVSVRKPEASWECLLNSQVIRIYKSAEKQQSARNVRKVVGRSVGHEYRCSCELHAR